uniref:Uncharacterized protein n=1 Tax=Oryzias sinensis TaxID=183150 RepID=A0A8C7YVW2_9TELE
MQLLRVAWALTGAAICCLLILLIHSRLLQEGKSLPTSIHSPLKGGREVSRYRRSDAIGCALLPLDQGRRRSCRVVNARCHKQWCEMVPCLEDEGCDLLVNKSGWTCTQPGGRVKTTTVGLRVPSGSEYCNVHPTRHLHTHTRKTKQKKVLSKEKL